MENQKKQPPKRVRLERLALFVVGAVKHDNHLELIAEVVDAVITVGKETLATFDPGTPSKVKHLLTATHPQLAIFCGGTGIGPEDRTVELLRKIADFEIPGVGEVLRREGLNSTPNAIIGRGGAWVLGQTLCLALSSGESALKDQLAILAPYLEKLLMGVGGKCPSRTATSNQTAPKAGDQSADLG